MQTNSTVHLKTNCFSHIEIGIHKYCNLKCPFCPHGQPENDDVMPKGKMSEQLYMKILKDLRDINFKGRISFHLMNEPLLSKNLLKFVKLAKEYCKDASILIVTNGSVMTYEYLNGLFESGVDRVAINHYSKVKNSKRLTIANILGGFLKTNKYSKKRQRFTLLLLLGVYYILTRDDSIKKYFRIIYSLNSKYLGNLAFNITRFYMTKSNRAGNVDINVLKEPIKEYCIYPFLQMYISYDGKTLPCSADYFHNEILGDVNKNSLLEIWNGDKYKNIREQLYQGDRSGLLCEKCNTYFLYEPDFYYPMPGE